MAASFAVSPLDVWSPIAANAGASATARPRRRDAHSHLRQPRPLHGQPVGPRHPAQHDEHDRGHHDRRAPATTTRSLVATSHPADAYGCHISPSDRRLSDHFASVRQVPHGEKRVGEIERRIACNSPTPATCEEAATAVTVQQSHRNRRHRGCTATEGPSLGVALYVTATLVKSSWMTAAWAATGMLAAATTERIATACFASLSMMCSLD